MVVFTVIRETRKGETYETPDIQALLSDFDAFVSETRPLVRDVPKHPEAALYRHVWKRAGVLAGMPDHGFHHRDAARYRDFGKLARRHYDRVAASNAYGRVRLHLSDDAFERLRQSERNRHALKTHPVKPDTAYACIYLGIDDDSKRPYVGQTLDEPERRWRQHRTDGSGPFKSGAAYAQWKVLERHVPLSQLNELESYYIGLYNALTRGHNSTCGNDRLACERGVSDWLDAGDDSDER